MKVECSATFDLTASSMQIGGAKELDKEERISDKKRLMQWLVELPEDAVIRPARQDYLNQLAAYWLEER